jgi:hypothetical protein
LDGTRSFDPEGVPLLYSWRLIGGPLDSSFVERLSDGSTYPLTVPTGFTSKFHSDALQAVHNVDNIVVGDVLLVDDEVYDIVSTGTDANGFFVLLAAEILPDNLGRLLRSFGNEVYQILSLLILHSLPMY